MRKIAYWIIAAALMSIVLFLALRMRQKGQTYAPEIVTFGDSVFGNVRDESGIPAQLEALTGRTVFNAAFGGTCAAKIYPGSHLDYSLDTLSLAALTTAVYSGEFGPQQTMQSRTDSALYFDGTVDTLEYVDFTGVEVVLIEQGTNDYLSGTPLEDDTDLYNEYTYGGALRSAVKKLREVNPNLRIILVSPTYIWLPEWNMDCEEYRGTEGAALLADYVAKQQEIAAECGLEFIDLYHDLYTCSSFEDWEKYTVDGVHPSEKSRVRIAEIIAERLKGGQQ